MEDKMKLELKHLVPYAPYKLRVELGGTVRDLTAISCESKYCFVTLWLGSREKQMVGIESIKPLLRPLSDLTKEIEHNGERFVPSEQIEAIMGGEWCKACDEWLDALIDEPGEADRLILYCPYKMLQYFVAMYFDIFSLIPSGLALPINK